MEPDPKDVYNKVLKRYAVKATALGADFAAIGAGVYKDVHKAIENMVQVDYRVDPIPENVKIYDKLYKIYGML